jgi:ABC-2 type transport system permease protein
VILTAAGSAVLLAVGGAVYGIPSMVSPVRAIFGLVLGALTFASLGLLIGSWMPNARAAQGVGLLLFFPSFLLGGAGPPPSQMGSTMRSVAQVIPLTHVTDAIRQPWLGLGNATPHLIVTAAIMLVAVLGWRRAVQL